MATTQDNDFVRPDDWTDHDERIRQILIDEAERRRDEEQQHALHQIRKLMGMNHNALT